MRVLELAEMRLALLGDRPESDATREIIHRALAYTAKLLTEAGVSVIVDATSPRRVWRELARELVGHFAEVQLVCPREICFDRERATRWRLGPQQSVARTFRPTTGGPDIALDYEPALCPELTLHTDTNGLRGTLDELLRLVHRLIVEAGSQSSGTPSARS